MQQTSSGTNRFGDYILHDRIGAGGMAEIFLATATGIEGFEKRVVIKRILPSLSDDEQFVRMFIEEAKLCVALRHPNIVQVHDLGEIEAQYYIAMEYVDGRDLLKTLAACGKKKIGFPTDIALFIIMEVLKGLHYAHQLKKPNGEPLGIIHRDVSPSNVLLSFEGEVKIGDFGIAKANTREKTATGILKGKFGYMAPEQVTGVPIDSRADIFAVGIVMYELLTGHRLFAGKNDLAVLEKVRDARIDPPPRHYRQDLDDELEHIVLRALSRDSRDRYQTAMELHDSIHEYVYRSRATVGPSHLARFMQTLFLNEPEEVDRRTRVRLPQPRAFPMTHVRANGSAASGKNGANGHTLELPAQEGSDFDEKTPLLDPADLPASRLSSAVAFISDVDSWEKAGSSSLLDYALADTHDHKEPHRSPPPPPPPDTLEPSQESTERTDVELDEIRSPQARVAAMRKAVQNEAPTEIDAAEKKSLKRNVETVYGRRPPDVEEDEEDTTQKRKDDPDPDQTDDDYHDPSDIVERTVSNSGDNDIGDDLDDEELTSEVEPTVRFDSNSLSLTPKDDSEETAREREEYDDLRDDTSGGTLQVESSDMPTAEVSEHLLRGNSDIRSETTTVPAPRSRPDEPMGFEGSRTDIQYDPPDALVSPILDDDEGAAERNLPVLSRPRADSMFDDDDRTSSDANLSAATDEESSAEKAVAEIRRARRSSRMASDIAKDQDHGPSRRRPITSRRPRPLLMPAEDEGEPQLTANRRSNPMRARRRGTATRSISVVNPRQASLRRAPIVQAKAREDSFTETTGSGSLVEETTDSGEMAASAFAPEPVVEVTPKRRTTSGVTAALSEAAVMDQEIADIRKSTSRGTPPIERTSPDGVMEEDDPDFDEEDTKQGIKVKEAVNRIQSRKRIVTQNFVLYGDKQGERQESLPGFGDDDSEISEPVITSAGRLEDEGASDLFGVLEVLDKGTLDELGFGGSDEEVSLETDSKSYGSGETRLGLLAGDDESTDGEAFSEEPTASVTDADLLSVSKLLENGAVEPVFVEVTGVSKAEESGISISFTAAEDEQSEQGDLVSDGPRFEFEFTDNEEPTQEQPSGEQRAAARSKSLLDMPAGIVFEETSNERSARLISDSFDVSPSPPPPRNVDPPEAAGPLPVRPVSMEEPRDVKTSYPEDDLPGLVDPARAKPSNASALRRVVQRHKVAKEVRAKGTPPAASPAPSPLPPAPEPASPTPAMSPKPSPARAAPSAGQFYPPVQSVEARPSGVLNKFATFAVLIAVLLAVAAAVSILLQNRSSHAERNVPIKPIDDEAAAIGQTPPPPPPPTLEPPPPVPAPPPPAAPPPPVVQQPKKIEKPAPPPPSPPPTVAKKKKKKAARPKDGNVVLRVTCDEPIDIKIAGVGTVKQKSKYNRRLKPGDYRVTLIGSKGRKSYELELVPGNPVNLQCKF